MLIILLTYILAEKFLEGVEVNQNYPMLLLKLVDNTQVDMTIRVAGAVAFKNYIKRNWKVVSFIINNNYVSLLIVNAYNYRMKMIQIEYTQVIE